MKRIRPSNQEIKNLALAPGRNAIRLPHKAQVLTVAYDENETLVITVIMDDERENFEDREFYVLSPGGRVPHAAGSITYLTSPRRIGRPAVHVFEIDSPEDGPPKVGSTRGASVVNENSGNVAGLLFQAGSLVAPGAGVSTIRRPDRGVYVQ